MLKLYVKTNVKNCTAKIKNMLSGIGLMNLWENQFFEKLEIILHSNVFLISKSVSMPLLNVQSITIYLIIVFISHI